MSANAALDVSIDLEANRAEGSVSFAIDELFLDGELRLVGDRRRVGGLPDGGWCVLLRQYHA